MVGRWLVVHVNVHDAVFHVKILKLPIPFTKNVQVGVLVFCGAESLHQISIGISSDTYTIHTTSIFNRILLHIQTEYTTSLGYKVKSVK